MLPKSTNFVLKSFQIRRYNIVLKNQIVFIKGLPGAPGEPGEPGEPGLPGLDGVSTNCYYYYQIEFLKNYFIFLFSKTVNPAPLAVLPDQLEQKVMRESVVSPVQMVKWVLPESPVLWARLAHQVSKGLKGLLVPPVSLESLAVPVKLELPVPKVRFDTSKNLKKIEISLENIHISLKNTCKKKKLDTSKKCYFNNFIQKI